MKEAEAIVHHEPPTLYLQKWLQVTIEVAAPVIFIWWVGLPKPLSASLVFWALGFTGLASALYHLVGRDALHPASMFCTLWSILFWVYAFSPFDLDVSSTSTILLVFLGVATFGIGCY